MTHSAHAFYGICGELPRFFSQILELGTPLGKLPLGVALFQTIRRRLRLKLITPAGHRRYPSLRTISKAGFRSATVEF